MASLKISITGLFKDVCPSFMRRTDMSVARLSFNIMCKAPLKATLPISPPSAQQCLPITYCKSH